MLRTTHTSTVTEDQIDHLGHMNVRFYAVNATAGTRTVLADLPGWPTPRQIVHDTYTRIRREQLLGAELEVRSLVLGGDAGGIRLHHELRNAATDDLAATFVHRVSPLTPDGEQLAVPEAAVAAAVDLAEPLPEHAQPRTVSLDADLLRSAPDLDTVVARGLAFRKPRAVLAEECDDQGRYRVDMAPALSWAGEQTEGEAPDHLHETSRGELMGMAVMETRSVFGTLPRLGDTVQSFAAGIAVGDKVLHRMNWAFDLGTGVLLNAFESVSMAFDVRGRKPMTLPAGYRRIEEARVHPDLAPQAPA